MLTSTPIPGETHDGGAASRSSRSSIAENQLQPGADAEQALAELFAPQFIQEIVAGGATPAT